MKYKKGDKQEGNERECLHLTGDNQTNGGVYFQGSGLLLPPHTHAHNGNEEIKMLDLQTKDWKRLAAFNWW